MASLSHTLVSAAYTLECSILPLSSYEMEIHHLIAQQRNQASPTPQRHGYAPKLLVAAKSQGKATGIEVQELVLFPGFFFLPCLQRGFPVIVVL